MEALRAAWGERLRAARQTAGLSQDQLAARSGVSQPAISQVEQGLTVPRYATMVALAAALEAEVAELFPVSVEAAS